MENNALDLNDTYTAKEIARLLGISDRRVRKLAEQGKLPCRQKEPSYRFDLCETVRAYCKRIEDQIESQELRYKRADLQTKKALLDIERSDREAQIKAVKAEFTALQLEEYRGNLHESGDVIEAIGEISNTAREKISKIHEILNRKIRKDLQADPALCSSEIADSLDEVLDEVNLAQEQAVETLSKSRRKLTMLEENDEDE